jgi:hypothetical protein
MQPRRPKSGQLRIASAPASRHGFRVRGNLLMGLGVAGLIGMIPGAGKAVVDLEVPAAHTHVVLLHQHMSATILVLDASNFVRTDINPRGRRCGVGEF